MEPIKFYIGQESGIVVENKDFDKSIFTEQYKQTFEIFNQIWSSQEILRYLTSSSVQQKDELKDIVNDSDKNKYQNRSNIIAFCGDRGEGKTSLLTSVREILRNNQIYEQAIKAKVLCDQKLWNPNDILALDIIDPLFFDNKHNLIDLLLGQMMVRLEDEERCRQERENYDVKKVELKNKLIQHFQRAKECLKSLNVEGNKSAYDDLENLDDLASGTKLKKELDNLFECYNEYFGVKRLVICVDDLDMNAEGGTNMAVQMRRYLCHSKHCILLVAVKVEQLEDIISSSINKYLGDKVVSLETMKEMSHRYVNKLLPLTSRVMMPLGTELVERPLQIIDRDNQSSPIRIVKEMVVLLIYQKTFFIFVNNRGLSPIVPTNLRELRHLIGELYAMPDAEKDNENVNTANKQIFKQYLYYEWTKCLNVEYQKDLIEIVENEDILSVNKKIVAFLCRVLEITSIVRHLSESEGKLIKSITNPNNQIYNVSLGDVFYLIHRVENTITRAEILNILFFVKAFYSIKLYELYDIITSDQSSVTTDDEKSLAKVFKSDAALKGTNILQKLLNGAYFTYISGDYIPIEKGGESRDKRIINAENLRQSFKNILGKPRKSKAFIENLHLCEFFALTTTIDLRQRDIEKLFDRTQHGPLYIQKHTITNNYLLFDVLSIFYNIVNIEETYRRFNSWCGNQDFYEIAKSNPDSLLRKMFVACTKGEQISNHIEPDMHGLLSSAVIRVADVQQSIEENGYSLRGKHGVGGNAENLCKIYTDIKDIEMHLYPILTEDTKDSNGLWKNDGHPLTFKFLNPIIDFLEKEVTNDKFDEIFTANVALKTNIVPEADADDIAKLDSVFGKALKGISTKFPLYGDAITIIISQEFSYVVNYLGGRLFVERIISKDKEYSLEELYDTLSPYCEPILKAKEKNDDLLRKQEKRRKEDEERRKLEEFQRIHEKERMQQVRIESRLQNIMLRETASKKLQESLKKMLEEMFDAKMKGVIMVNPTPIKTKNERTTNKSKEENLLEDKKNEMEAIEPSLIEENPPKDNTSQSSNDKDKSSN